MHRDEALDALERADTVGARAHGRGRWYMLFAVLFAATTFALTVTIGLFPSTVTIFTATSVCLVVLACLVTFALRQPVQPRGYGWLHGAAMLGWGTVYGVTLFAGYAFFPEDPVWWVSGAALGAVPPLVAGWLAVRESRNTA
ncbi:MULTISPECIES: hypothetical protein [Nocardiopsis]|uniref:Uncharacterized protein n=1 Tax=Nocardiopsis sinuspersici TaxID=501010 RepID=A0A1V3C039_9ACTN|nr:MULTISPECIES: hypothetical protein [Nocardiopsis]OOC54164.1 hypothetical protein NOSIN_10390 [Nocardiopsis sinuspersici]